ncbi:hypothetical protein FC96_GL000839 [Secundilactobacillus kimchicus JCM 15530]|uniref:Uncharacterized protein n=1 Tax=Secundilactobacillus kimchicus JCM 15530 TaxID=1302272 RepID=A0A0R1HT73_9LACO|nr:hypothetical protein [Secundilactobacillus kimchicus]KRK46948.1 hypothetical protein FC96_GL000839 [Secundilactobacillus kimchicus JCM 15530]
MEISVETLTETLEEGNYNVKEFTTSLADVAKKGSAAVLQPLVDNMATAIQNTQLAQANLLFSDADITVRLENNVINLPYQNINPMKKMLAPEATMAVNVYSIIESPDVNVSSLRIDKVASADDFVKHVDEMAAGVATWLDDKLTIIKNHEDNAEEAKQPKKS